jgi:hypothetical protein
LATAEADGATVTAVLPALTQTAALSSWPGVFGAANDPIRMVCSLEFVERSGWKLAETLTPITCLASSRWPVATGMGLLV